MDRPEEKFNERLSIFINRTKCHAIPRVINSRILMKIVYIIISIIFTCFCISFIVEAFDSFFSNQISTKVKLIQADELEFPTITFCNLQICGFKDYNYKKYLKIYTDEENLKFQQDQNKTIEEKLKRNSTKTSFFSAKEIFLRKYNDTDLIRILSRNKTSINTMLIECEFNGKKCGEQDFEFFTMGEFQKCYKFNSGKFFNGTTSYVRKTNKFGQKSGLRLELFIGNQKDCQSPLSTTSGLIVYIANNTYTLTEEDDAIQIKPGTEANIAITTTTVNKLPHPYSDCFESEEKAKALSKNTALITNTTKLTKIYTQQYCLQLCYQNFIMEFCDCYDHTLPNFDPDGYEACPKFIDSLYNCQYLIKRLFYNGKNDEHCIKECPKECDYTSYSNTISYRKYPTQSYFEMMKYLKENKKISLNGNLEPANESMLALNVFYETSVIKAITEHEAITTMIFVSNIGGYIGLFLGYSILSIACEVIEFIIELIIKFIMSCFNRTKNKKI